LAAEKLESTGHGLDFGNTEMVSRNGWLFPLMVVAAGSVTAFGAIGIAVITGYLPLARGVKALGDYPPGPAGFEQTAASQVPGDPRQPMAVVAVEQRSGSTKVMEFQPDKPVAVPRRTPERTVN